MPHGTELRPEAVERFEVALGQLAETATPERGEPQPDHPLVAAVGSAPGHEAVVEQRAICRPLWSVTP